MENKKQKTVDILKETRKASENGKIRVKEFMGIKKKIKASLKLESKTIPQIIDETKLDASFVTYSLMTMMKYGDVQVDKIDDDDEYYFYKLKEVK